MQQAFASVLLALPPWESVLGDVLSIHPQSLEVEVMHGGRLGMAPAVGADKELTPAPRFAHTAVAVPWPPASKAVPSPDQRMERTCKTWLSGCPATAALPAHEGGGAGQQPGAWGQRRRAAA
ncbi:hypothetical protein HaLaN_10556 [Haematococcus lacustris]|uniref:Uncharacterized protein n=1 Tax=Haematococcus lacustris TaxID=44745 RepID=A0A699ZFY0_HAELA|nr:hypothetical protein HaLaN_10556 [Haematococcus lacustris]